MTKVYLNGAVQVASGVQCGAVSTLLCFDRRYKAAGRVPHGMAALTQRDIAQFIPRIS